MPPKGGLSIKIIQLEHSCVLALSFEALLQVNGPFDLAFVSQRSGRRGRTVHLASRVQGSIPTTVLYKFYFSRYFNRGPLYTDRGRILELPRGRDAPATANYTLNLTSLWGGSQLTTHMPTSSPQKSAFAHLKTSILLNQLAQIQQNLNKASCLSKSSPLSLGGVLEWRPPCPQKVV